MLSVCQGFVSLSADFPEKGEFLPFLGLCRGTCMTWELCMPLLLIPYLTCASARLRADALQTSGYSQTLASGWRKGKWKHSAKEQNCCGSWRIPQKMGWSLSSDVSFVCDCWWQLHLSMVQSQVGNETFWIPSGTWNSLDLLDQVLGSLLSPLLSKWNQRELIGERVNERRVAIYCWVSGQISLFSLQLRGICSVLCWSFGSTCILRKG